jgi:hypothetical protein
MIYFPSAQIVQRKARKGQSTMKKLTAREKIVRLSIEKDKRKKRKVARSLQAGIDRAVKIIRRREKKIQRVSEESASEAGAYAFHNKRALFNSGRLRGAKVG